MDNKDNKKIAAGKKRGVVAGVSSVKTLVVEVARFETHPKYRKKIRITKRYKVHFGDGEYKIGDKVEIEPCRPISKEKRYKLAG
jgi:small subunit ribosomal protein S17